MKRKYPLNPSYCIYGLTDASGCVFAVGSTSLQLSTRLARHCTRARKGEGNRTHRHIASMLARGERPSIRMLATAKDKRSALMMEATLIAHLRSFVGLQLTNQNAPIAANDNGRPRRKKAA